MQIPPIITLVGPEFFDHPCGLSFEDPGVIATDGEDKDITEHVIREGYVDVNQPGTYLLTYNVSDEYGNSSFQEKRYVTVG